ncbi:hypothetical protein BJF79_46195 [Actinomadura sp. CNU-125]|uniref:hypothetical protein n=1 Tax=Actinomadura sp. CNU-125 TaxID=1904961 RepID=UPI000958E78D|nr:hypothetical protein [Actinomadura sp. CNU-125]OLT22877.1 hypothetical protein BJF79_46195 [Actinomadura sp. CNU-125]
MTATQDRASAVSCEGTADAPTTTAITVALLRLEVATWQHTNTRNPIAAADQQTSVADTRTALALARGIPPRHIDPATGVDLSPRAYRTARNTWTRDTAPAGLDEWLARAPHIVAAVEEAITQ